MGLIEDLGKYRNKIINILIIVIAIVIAVNIYKNQSAIIERLNSQKEEEMEKNAMVERIIKLKDKLDKYKNFINSKDISRVINSINIIARDAGVKIVSIKPGNSRKEGIYEVFPFNIAIDTPGYKEIGNFISVLESAPEIFIVTSVNFSTQKEISEASGKAAGNILNVNLTLSTILLK